MVNSAAEYEKTKEELVALASWVPNFLNSLFLPWKSIAELIAFNGCREQRSVSCVQQ